MFFSSKIEFLAIFSVVIVKIPPFRRKFVQERRRKGHFFDFLPKALITQTSSTQTSCQINKSQRSVEIY